MEKLTASSRSLNELLKDKKYEIPYYQRNYKWGEKQINEMLNDLIGEFEEYNKDGDAREAVRDYGEYFMGTVIIANGEQIIDGQQRLTSLTLLLIYLNNKISSSSGVTDSVGSLIFSDMYGKKSFNLKEESWKECFEILFSGGKYDLNDSTPSDIKNIVERYADIQKTMDEFLNDDNLLHFKDWLIHKLCFIEITTTSPSDAHKVFVSMNDRGLSLTSTEMLKGHLLSKINEEERGSFENTWVSMIEKLTKTEKKGDDEFIKAWLRGKYATKIRSNDKGSPLEDYDWIGLDFYKWIVEKENPLKLEKPKDSERIISNMNKYSDIYLKLKGCASKYDSDYPYIYYNAKNNFSTQYNVILSAISESDLDKNDVINHKIQIVSCFIDQAVTRRILNNKKIGESVTRYSAFKWIKELRDKPIEELKTRIIMFLDEMETSEEPLSIFNGAKSYAFQKQTKNMHQILARITAYVQKECQVNGDYREYANCEAKAKNKFEIEHILANKYEEHYKDLFRDNEEFQRYRNQLGSLLLISESVNKGINDSPYDKKLETYREVNNILAQTLNRDYKLDSRTRKFLDKHNLKFNSYPVFDEKAIKERQELYAKICELIWDKNLINDL
jgi:uncharacterized protein with ParB-like and HNH nuclease domain